MQQNGIACCPCFRVSLCRYLQLREHDLEHNITFLYRREVQMLCSRIDAICTALSVSYYMFEPLTAASLENTSLVPCGPVGWTAQVVLLPSAIVVQLSRIRVKYKGPQRM